MLDSSVSSLLLTVFYLFIYSNQAPASPNIRQTGILNADIVPSWLIKVKRIHRFLNYSRMLGNVTDSH